MTLFLIIVQMVPVRCISRSYRLKIDFHKSFLKPQGLEPCIWFVGSSSGPLPTLFKLYPWDQKWASPGGHLYIGKT